MMKERYAGNRIVMTFLRAGCILLAVMLTVMCMCSDMTYAAAEKTAEEPIREVHRVSVGNKTYCFFVTHNVVLTPAEVAEMTDDELNAEILERSGFYMKQANCKKSSHKAITAEDWAKDNGKLFLEETDIEAIRSAEPVDGAPVKLHMDLRIATETSEEETPEGSYSTYKRLSPRLIFIAVATEEDAASGEDLCEEEKKPSDTKKKKSGSKSSRVSVGGGGDDDDMLPEYRTINMADRSGAPVEDTLEDGTSVTLEWIDTNDNTGNDKKESFFETAKGKITAAAVICALAAGLAAAVLAGRKRRKERE